MNNLFICPSNFEPSKIIITSNIFASLHTVTSMEIRKLQLAVVRFPKCVTELVVFTSVKGVKT
jgi:hypothetical protein